MSSVIYTIELWFPKSQIFGMLSLKRYFLNVGLVAGYIENLQLKIPLTSSNFKTYKT